MIKNNYLRLCAKKLIYSIKEIMKKILILAYDFPPYVSVGGLRPYSWYKYLHEFDVYPIVITRQWNNKYGNHLDYIAPSDSNETIIEKTEKGTIIKTPYKPNFSNRIMLKYGENKYKLVRKIFSAYYELAQHIFKIGPKLPLYMAAEDFLKRNKVDAIIATAEPFVLFKYASKLSIKYNIPWIADYRDPWSQNSNRSKTKLHKRWNIYFEKMYVKSAVSITTVNEFYKIKIQQLFKNKNSYVISNGYDNEIIDKIPIVQQNTGILSIAYAGTIYKWHPVASVLGVFNDFIKNHNEPVIQLHFYGINNKSFIEKLILEKFPYLRNFIFFIPKMPNNELLNNLASHNLLLLFNYYSFIGMKIYDYLALKRKILLCYSDDKESNILKRKYYSVEEINGISHSAQEELLIKTNSGLVAKNSKHLYQLLEMFYKEFLMNGFIECNSTNIEQYSRLFQAQKLANIIKYLS